jgi:hypothetical protein
VGRRAAGGKRFADLPARCRAGQSDFD